MFTTKLRRIIRWGMINFWRSGTVSLSSVLVLTITLFVVGSLLLSNALLRSALEQIKSKVDVNVYFKIEAPEAAILNVQKYLSSLPEVQSIDYVSREKALAAFKERHVGDTAVINALEEIGDNPLGASLNIKAKDPSQYEGIAKILQPDASLSTAASPIDTSIIYRVNYYKNKVVIERLNKIITSTRQLGFAVSILLATIAVLVTYNTIRLTIYIAKEEIAVMKLVGASNNYVRGPFMFEGVIYGALASVLVMILLFAISLWLGSVTENFFSGMNLYLYFKQNALQIFVIILATGAVLGSFSSYLAVRRYLSV